MKKQIFQTLLILFVTTMMGISSYSAHAGWVFRAKIIYSCIIIPPFVIIDVIIIRSPLLEAPARVAINIPKEWNIEVKESAYFHVGNKVNGEKKFFTFSQALSEELESTSPKDGFKWVAFEDTQGYLDNEPVNSEVVVLWKLKPLPEVPSNFTLGVATGSGEGWLDIRPESPATCPASSHLPVELSDMQASPSGNNVSISWKTGTEIDNASFLIWRATDSGKGEYEDITTLGPIAAKGSKEMETTYSYRDISTQEKNVTYYYLLEDVDINGTRTFHCDDIAAVTVGQGPTINLEAVKEYCRASTIH